jgi:DNA polymerase III delta prime subunit
MSKKQLSYSLWVEKYRPENINQVLLPKELKNFFQQLVKDKEIPNLFLFSSSPGTGKCLTGDMEVEIEINEEIYQKNKEKFEN